MEFDFTKDYILQNELVKLIPLNINYLKPLRTISNEKFIWNFFLEKGLEETDFKKYIETALLNRKAGKEYPFVIIEKISQKIVGMTRIYEVSCELKNMKIGHTWIGKEFRGTEINRQCKCILFEFIFETIQAVRIGFGVHGENIRSIKALKSVGCSKEGMLKDYLISHDGKKRVDLLLFSILKKDWHQQIKAELLKKLKNP